MDKAETDTKTSNWSKIIKSFLWDFILLTVLIINLLFLCWDWIFSIPAVTNFFLAHAPGFYNFYYPLHVNTQAIDLMFIAIYIIDIAVGWSLSFFKKKERWYKYPLSHWYDILGCIPAGSLVCLRLLRFVSIFIRLSKKKLVNLSKITLFRKLIELYNIIIEEIADHVVLNILGGIKSNVRSGMPVAKEIIEKILRPHKEQITSLLLYKMRDIAQREYNTHKAEIAEYIKTSSRRAVDGNKELARLKLIPVLGNQITETISNSVSQTIATVIDNIATDTFSDDGQAKMKSISDEVTGMAFEDIEQQLSPIVTDIVVESIALIARAAGVRQWKLNEIRERIAIAKTAENPDKELLERLETEYQTMFITEFEKNLGKE